jgi:hypothetical protein
MTNAIERYLNSLSEDILTLHISSKGIKSLPDLTRFKNLEKIDCSHNQLSLLPTLPQYLKILICDNNQLTCLPTLPKNLEYLFCVDNQLTCLPTLPKNLQELYCNDNQLSLLPNLSENLKILCCYNNQLTCLPTLPKNLEELYCINNQLHVLPNLPQNLEELDCFNNPIYEIVNNNSLIKIKKNVQILNNFRHLYYCLKFKKQLRKWLWEKVREPNVKKLYNPNYLVDNLGDEDDLDTVLDNWK